MSHFRVLWRRSTAFRILLVVAGALSISGIALLYTSYARSTAGKSRALEQSKFTAPAIATPQATGATQEALATGSPGVASAHPGTHAVASEPRRAAMTPSGVAAGEARAPVTTSKGERISPVPANTSIAAPQNEESPRSFMGKAFDGQLPINGRSAPLPDGRWIVVAHFPATMPGTVESVVLAQPRDKVLAAAIVIQSSQLPPERSTGFRRSTQCERTALLYFKTLSNEDFGRQDCWTINHNISAEWGGRNAPGIMRAAVGELGVRGVEVPPVMVSVFYRLADKQSFLHAVYYFNPEVDGIKSSPTLIWEESDWHRQFIRQYPDKVAYFEKTRTWSEGWHAQVSSGFDAARAPTGRLQTPAK